MAISGKAIIINITSIKKSVAQFSASENNSMKLCFICPSILNDILVSREVENLGTGIKISAISFFSCDFLLGPQKNIRSRISVHVRIQNFCALWMSEGLFTWRRQPMAVGEPHLLVAPLADHHLNWAGNNCNEKDALLIHYCILISTKKVSKEKLLFIDLVNNSTSQSLAIFFMLVLDTDYIKEFLLS